ncbi:MAG: O-antigen ligase family protein, partial [Lentisphaeraceae bacterium]|nr:O-antigen ligase family protein [Lentisphaeraceae bacterium]
GVAGNVNWLSACVLASAIPAYSFVYQIISSRVNNIAKHNLTFVLVILPTIPIILRADSRASYAALALLVFYIPFMFLRKKGKMILALTLVTGTVVLSLVLQDKIDKELRRNIRGELYSSTFYMIKDKPLLGWGQNQFERNYPKYVSRKQKMMLVGASNTAHPHNELLHMGIIGGFPLMLAWFILVGSALCFRAKNKVEIACQLALFILTVQGLADKPLFLMPNMLFFYILLGVMWAPRAKSMVQVSFQKMKFRKVLLFIIPLFFLFFIQANTRSSLLQRQAMRLRSDAFNEKNEAKLMQSYQSYHASHLAAPWRYKPAYEAFKTALVDLNNVALARELHDYLASEVPMYLRLYGLRAKYYQMLADHFPDQKGQFIQQSLEMYQQGSELHAGNFKAHSLLLKSAARYSPQKVKVIHDKQVAVYKHKMTLWAEEHGVDLASLTTEWKIKKKYSEKMAIVERFLGGFKPSFTGSVFLPTKYKGPWEQQKIHLGDMKFAAESQFIIDSFKWNKPPHEIVRNVFNLVNTLDGEDFSWPYKLLLKKKGSRLSQLCLISQILRFQNFNTVLLKQDKKMNALIWKGEQVFLLQGERLLPANKQSVVEFLKGKKAIYFDYPQAFCYKNELVSYALAESGELPVYSRLPELALTELYLRWPIVKVSILMEPFLLYEKGQ